jgi:dolichyl-diphosphooligosaccharide--protein glycosyltransferase
LHAFTDYVRSRLTAEQFDVLFRSVLMAAGSFALAAMGILTITGVSELFHESEARKI